jgi:hypothetical protein
VALVRGAKPMRAEVWAQGLRPIQIWVPDMRASSFGVEAHKQSLVVATIRGSLTLSAWSDEWGEVWAVSGGKDLWASRACRHRVGRQLRRNWISACPFPPDPTDAPLFWLKAEPSALFKNYPVSQSR